MKAATDKVDGTRPRSWQLVMLVQSMLFAMLLLFAILFSLFEQHPEGFIYPVCVFLLILFAWTLWSWRALTGNLFDPYILFMLSAFMFNAGLAFLEIFHLNKGGLFEGVFSRQTILETLFLVTICLTAFHSGALIAIFIRYRKGRTSAATQKQEQDGRPLRLVGWGLICIAAIPTVLLLRNYISVVISSGYIGLYQQQFSTGFGAWPRVFSAFLVPGTLFLLAGSKGKKSGIFGSLGIMLFYCAVMLFLGARAGVIMPLVAYFWLWHRVIHKIPKVALVSAAMLILLVLVPLLPYFRTASGHERYSITRTVDEYFSIENPALAGLTDMGGSMRTVSYTIDLVPETRGYDMGASYYYALLTVFPNAFWSIHPSMARGIASEWLVQTVDPEAARMGAGIGYSFIAEAYLNFGWWGAPIVLILMGFLFGSLVLWADRSGDIARLAMVASFLSFFLVFPRGESILVVRALVWYSALPYLAVRFIGRRSSRCPTNAESLVAGSLLS